MKRYKVSCKNCDGQRLIEIHPTQLGERVDWLEGKQSEPFTIVSARKRLDDQWGFQCICGENDLMTAQERESFKNTAAPKPQEITDIVKNLKPDKPRFELVEA